MFSRRKVKDTQHSIREKINNEYNIKLREEQEHYRRLNTDTYTTHELDKII